MHKGDIERGMLNPQPTLYITHSNRYQVRAQVNKVKSHFIQSARDNLGELYNLHRCKSTAELYNFLIPFWQRITVLFLSQRVWQAVYAVQIQRGESRKQLTNGSRPLDLLAETIPRFIYIKFYLWVNNCGRFADGFYISMIDDKDSHIPSPLIMFTCAALRHALLEW
jgi:hypothetical protein